jgi:hypothetical protein
MPITAEVADFTSKWMAMFRAEWKSEAPQRLHIHALDRGGAPQWSPELASWLSDGRGANGERRYRMTQAMRKLRKKSVREYEVAYRMIVLGEPIEQTTKWLNERAIRNDKPERYRLEDTRVIIVSAVDKLLAWY